MKIILIKIVAILMMSTKWATLNLLKVKVTWNKSYDVIISVYDVTTKFYYMTQITL